MSVELPELPETARRLDFAGERDRSSTSWERASEVDGEISPDGHRGRYEVALADGERAHTVILVEDGEGMIGACDCNGFAFHGDPDETQRDLEGGQAREAWSPCAHLCYLRQEAVLNEGLVPSVDITLGDGGVPGGGGSDTSTSSTDASEADVEVLDEDASDQDGEGDRAEPDGGDEPPANRDDHAGGPTLQRPDPDVDVEAVDSQEEFVEEIAGVPSVFVVDMGRGRDSKPYVTKEGLTYIANKAGIETRAEPISPTWEDDADVAAYRGVAVDAEGRRYEDVATAHASEVENTVGRENLDELASTRATNRALRLATGCGFATVEEVDGQAIPEAQASATAGGED